MTPAVSPSPKATPKADTPKPRSAKQQANDALVEALRLAFFTGQKKPPVELGPTSYGNYMKVAQALIGEGLTTDDFLPYVEYWAKAAATWPGGLTLNSLTTNGRIADFKSWRASQQRTQQSAKQGYDPRSDPAYAYRHAENEGGAK
jgi:hypothetical protein